MKHIFFTISALLLALCWLAIPACKKDATPYSNQYRWQMNGRVLEYGSGKPLVHALAHEVSNASGLTVVDAGGWAAGLYLVEVNGAEGKSWGKVVVER